MKKTYELKEFKNSKGSLLELFELDSDRVDFIHETIHGVLEDSKLTAGEAMLKVLEKLEPKTVNEYLMVGAFFGAISFEHFRTEDIDKEKEERIKSSLIDAIKEVMPDAKVEVEKVKFPFELDKSLREKAIKVGDGGFNLMVDNEETASEDSQLANKILKEHEKEIIFRAMELNEEFKKIGLRDMRAIITSSLATGVFHGYRLCLMKKEVKRLIPKAD